MPLPAVIMAARRIDKATGGHGSKALKWAVLSPLVVMVLMAAGIGGPIAEAQGTCGPGELVPASADIPASAMAAINSLKADYEFVANQEGLSWSLLASIDYRENGNDPDRSMLGGELIGTAAADSGEVSTSKRDSIIRGARHLKGGAQQVYGVDLTAGSGGDDVKKAIIAYNRWSAYQSAGASPDLSPYVMNQYDASHVDMTFPTIPGETLAGMTEYGRFGAFTLFTRLGGSAGNCGLSANDIVRIAQQQIGLAETPDGCNCGEPIQKFLGSSAGEFWCADFVSWVYNEAGHPFTGGADGGWRIANVGVMHDYLAAHGRWFDATSAEDPAPGDVITFRDDEHVGIVEYLDDAGTPGDKSDDRVHTIEGNTTNMVARGDYGRVGDTIVGWGRP